MCGLREIADTISYRVRILTPIVSEIIGIPVRLGSESVFAFDKNVCPTSSDLAYC